MAETARILRKTVHAFLCNYHSCASVAALLVIPLTASLLFSQALIGSSPDVVDAVQSHIQSLFEAAGFPISTGFFSLLELKLSQTIFSLAFTVPFTLTFLALAKAAVVRIVFRPRQSEQGPPSFTSFACLYAPVVQTYVWSYFTVLSANATVLSLLFVAFNFASIFHISSPATNTILSIAGGIAYSIILAQVVVACNLAIIISGFENQGGALQILKAFLLLRGRTSTCLSLALPANIAMAATEGLFQFRVVKDYLNSSGLRYTTMGEAFTISYMYSLLVVIDTIAMCMFFKSCKLRNLPSWRSETCHQAEKQLEDDEYTELVCSKC